MLGEEELVQQPVDLDQAVAAQAQNIVVDTQEAPVLQPAELTREPAADVDPELVMEVVAFHSPEFHLQNEFPDHPLFVGWRQRAVNRKLAFSNLVDIGTELMLVLKMRAAHVREG